MFDILMYLFENYIHGDIEIMIDHDELADELTRAGFHKDEIFKALSWIENLSALQDSDIHPYLCKRQSSSMRVFTMEERMKLDTESIGFIMFLERINVLDVETREMVIDRVMELDSPEIALDDLKWVILMVLFNVPGHESAYSQMEDLIFDEQDGPLH